MWPLAIDSLTAHAELPTGNFHKRPQIDISLKRRQRGSIYTILLVLSHSVFGKRGLKTSTKDLLS